MAVHLTRIYTKTGDAGTTRLGNNEVAAEDRSHGSPRTPTSTSATPRSGVALALGELADDVRAVLDRRSRTTCSTWAPTCATRSSRDPAYPPLRITEEYVTRLEGWCDEYNERLTQLDSFILPGGTPGAALLHVARTVARRAERSAWALLDADPDRTSALPAKYLNRLSDLLFILSRVANPDGDVKWVPGAQR